MRVAKKKIAFFHSAIRILQAVHSHSFIILIAFFFYLIQKVL